MPGAIHFTHATDAAGVKAEFVEDLKNRAKAKEAAARSGGEKEKKAEQAAAAALVDAANYWESVLIGNPVGAKPPQQAPAAPSAPRAA